MHSASQPDSVSHLGGTERAGQAVTGAACVLCGVPGPRSWLMVRLRACSCAAVLVQTRCGTRARLTGGKGAASMPLTSASAARMRRDACGPRPCDLMTALEAVPAAAIEVEGGS